MNKKRTLILFILLALLIQGCSSAQDVPQEVVADVTFWHGEQASVVMRTSFPNHFITLDLQQSEGDWKIGNITCGFSPEGTAIVHLQFGTETVRHLKVTAVQELGAWKIDSIALAKFEKMGF